MIISSAEIAAMKQRELANGTTRAEYAPIVTPHGPVLLSGPNWQAIADVLELLNK